MSVLALYYRAVGEFGMFFIYIMMGWPQLLLADLMDSSNLGLLNIATLIAPVFLLIFGIIRFRRGYPRLLMFTMHLGIVVGGLIAVVIASSTNFKFVI
jgi:hypothetical protein